MPLTFHSITNIIDCEFRIESELHFDEGKMCAVLRAIPVYEYLYVCLVIEEFILISIKSLVMEHSCKFSSY